VTAPLLLLVGLAAYMLAEAARLAWAARAGRDPAARRLERYVARRAPGRLRRRPAAQGPRVPGAGRLDRWLVRARAVAALERRLREAGIPLAASEALLLAGAGTVAAAGTAAAARGVAAGAITGAACLVAAWRGLAALRDRRVRRLDLQLPAALDLLIGHLRAHRSPAEAITEVARQVSEPLRGECARVAEEVRLGASLPQALDALRRRIPSRPLSTVVTAILVTDRAGGDLAEFLARQSRTVRDQVAFLQEVSAVTAHARSTAAILTLLPAGVAAAMSLLEPAFLSPMLAPGPGRALLLSAATMQVLGWQVIRAMIRSVER
jgi:tight adherence protein B